MQSSCTVSIFCLLFLFLFLLHRITLSPYIVWSPSLAHHIDHQRKWKCGKKEARDKCRKRRASHTARHCQRRQSNDSLERAIHLSWIEFRFRSICPPSDIWYVVHCVYRTLHLWGTKWVSEWVSYSSVYWLCGDVMSCSLFIVRSFSFLGFMFCQILADTMCFCSFFGSTNANRNALTANRLLWFRERFFLVLFTVAVVIKVREFIFIIRLSRALTQTHCDRQADRQTRRTKRGRESSLISYYGKLTAIFRVQSQCQYWNNWMSLNKENWICKFSMCCALVAKWTKSMVWNDVGALSRAEHYGQTSATITIKIRINMESNIGMKVSVCCELKLFVDRMRMSTSSST